MQNNTSHPLAQPTHARIDINYGSRQREVIKDSVKFTRDAIVHLDAGDHILCLNTITSHKRMEMLMDSISERHAAKVKTFSESGAELIEHLPMLTKMVEDKRVRIIILNSLDFATQSPRQRTQLVHWLRKMRDDFEVRVIVYTMNEPAKFGATGQLAWIADTVEETHCRTESAKDNFDLGPNNSNVALEEELQHVGQSSPTDTLSDKTPTTNFVDTPLNYKDLQPQRASALRECSGMLQPAEEPALAGEMEFEEEGELLLS
ncbi:MAG TPA: hypothetical protein VFH43_06070 [Candidatus Kapabacteria bacterium]|nr:hypothetical protein [Candidatus Kapabacteria bacterium]